MSQRESLLAAVYENREDDAPRLVLADWLTDQGDPRGEFIQVQCRLALLKEDDPARPSLERREQDLLAAHDATWRTELPAMPGFVWGLFRRGFVETASVPDVRREALPFRELYDGFIEVGRKQPWHLRPLIEALVAARGPGPTWLRAGLAFLPMNDWPALAEQALEVLEQGQRNEAAEGVLEDAAEQCPEALHPHLDRLFALRTLPRSFERFPWHRSGARHVDFLTRAIREDNDAVRAWWLLLATRDDTAIRAALSHAVQLHRRRGSTGEYERWLRAYFVEEGLAREQGQVRLLHRDRPYHLAFPDGYAESSHHPTWHDLSDLSDPLRFGGEGANKCGCCKQKLHHLITLDPVPADLGVSASSLTLEACLSCLGWEKQSLFYDHNARGKPRCRRKGDRITPRFPSGPLQQTQVRLGRAHPRWTWQRWGSGAKANLHRVGGPPSWVQGADYPDCPGCSRAMAFLMQLDSHFPTADGQHDWLWGSGGVAYGLWCDRCRVSGWLWQCT